MVGKKSDRSQRNKKNVSMRGKRGPSKENMSMRGKASKEKAKTEAKTADAGSKFEKTADKKNPPQQPSKAPKKSAVREKMNEGDKLKSEKFTWVVSRILGSGGFGDVYKVTKENNDDKQEYALKTEQIGGERRLLRLKIEAEVLVLCNAVEDPEKKKHFVVYTDRGITDKFKFVVMELVGPSLEDIRKKFLGNKFSINTAFYCALQTLEAIRDLHAVGWLHRDIKPHNFCVGLGDKEDTVYMLDFGIARKIYSMNGRSIKVARKNVPFLGTLRYASRACHTGYDQGMRDDLETWVYMFFEMVDYENGLPWKKAQDRSEIIDMKEQFCNYCPRDVFGIMPVYAKEIVEYVNRLRYHEEPNYYRIYEMLDEVCTKARISMTDKPEWLGKLVKNEDEETKGDEKEGSADNKQSGEDDGEDEKEPEPEKKVEKSVAKKPTNSVRSTRRKLK